jgi:hypothetical protein
MSSIAIFYPDKCIPKLADTAQIGFDKIFLSAGTNKLTTETLKQLQEHPDYSRYIEMGAIDIMQEEPSTVDPLANTDNADLMQFKESEALKIINNTQDVPTLEQWLAVEQRTKIRTVLNTRITQLKTGVV